MKTFEEALNTVIVCRRVKPSDEEIKKLRHMVEDNGDRYRELGEQAAANEELNFMIHAMIGSLDPYNCCMNAFIFGLRTGIEMERVELPESLGTANEDPLKQQSASPEATK